MSSNMHNNIDTKNKKNIYDLYYKYINLLSIKYNIIIDKKLYDLLDNILNRINNDKGGNSSLKSFFM